MANYSAADIRSFVLETLRVSGAAYREVDPDLLLAEVTVEIPPIFFDPPRLEKQTLNLVFTPEAGATYPGAELVIPGSYRLNWFIDGLKERGNYTLQSFKYDLSPEETRVALAKLCPELEKAGPLPAPTKKTRPYLLVNYTLSYQTDELREELVSLGLDMVNGKISPDFIHFLADRDPLPAVAGTEVETPSYQLDEAFALLQTALEAFVLSRDPAWVDDARTRYEEELSCLYQYYQEDRRDLADFQNRALDLYDKFRPRVVVRVVNVGLLYLPVLVYKLPEDKDNKNTLLHYLPFLNQVEKLGVTASSAP
jgi:hypothetical protein